MSLTCCWCSRPFLQAYYRRAVARRLCGDLQGALEDCRRAAGGGGPDGGKHTGVVGAAVVGRVTAAVLASLEGINLLSLKQFNENS